MQRMNELFERAVNHTKVKVYEDIDRFLGTKLEAPHFSDYLRERTVYLEQIWINVWLNMTHNEYPRKEKKSFLTEKGYEVDGIDKKIINKIFRNEMRTHVSFDVLAWVTEKFKNDEEAWRRRYPMARETYIQRQEEECLAEKKRQILQHIENTTEKTIERGHDNFYLYVRNYVARKFVIDLNKQPKYGSIDTFMIEEKLVEQGPLNPSKYTTMASFFHELTGNVHKLIRWEYETYKTKYKNIVKKYVKELVPAFIYDELLPEMLAQYEQFLRKKLSLSFLSEMIDEELACLESEFFTKIEEEYVDDLIKLTRVPFSLSEHKKIYEHDLQERERKKEEERAEIERKKAEEERMLEDIFGREYYAFGGRKMRYVLHIGETNTGKTFHALERMKQAPTGIYLAPLRLLALEVYEKLTKEGVHCGLKTGEEEKDVDDATHLSCTVEMFHEKTFFDVIVIDEAQMIADRDRGFSWYKAITKANANELHIIGSLNSKEMILQLLGDSPIQIKEYYREVPLVVEKKEFNLKQTQKGDALVCFSRKIVLETASKLENDRYSVSMIYGSMPPETRKKQMDRFINGETTVIVATDAIGMGLNLPIRRIVFLENEKFDGVRRRTLTSQEVKQIAGRAGRKGIYDVGKVAFTKDIRFMKRLLEQEDVLISQFAIAPTTAIFERFQKYYRDLSKFFELWHKFESPKGTRKASLSEERELYATIRDTEVEARLSMMDLYGFLHLPFSKKDPELIKQWRDTMFAIIRGKELPEPIIKRDSLEELELSYKAIGLQLLFLYRLGRGTEAIYWERMRGELSDEIHERLKTDVKSLTKKCKRCEKILPLNFNFQICDACHYERRKRREF